MSYKNLKRISASILVTILGATTLVSCSSDKDCSEEKVVCLGTTDATSKALIALQEQAQANDIDLELISFAGFTEPNTALAQGEVETNLFQHSQYLSLYNVKNNANLVPVGSTQIYPLSLFWKDHNSLSGIDGETVAIPNDPTNQGRAIKLLASKELVTIKESAKDRITPSVADISTEDSKVTLKPVDAAQTSAAYGEGTPAVLNNTFVGRAGIDPTTAVVQDDPDSPEAEPYINIFVTREENKNDPQIHKLVELWHTPEVQAAEKEDSKGTSVEVKKTPEELQKLQKRLEDAERNAIANE